MSRPDTQGPALVILAGGASSRLGTCKALVNLGGGAGDTPLLRLLRAASVLNDSKPLVVSGKHHLEIQQRAPTSLQVLHNRDWARGRTGSVATASAARPGRDLLIAPVDVPRVPATVFESMARAWEEAGSPAQGWLAPYCRRAVESAQDGFDRHAQPKWHESESPRRFGHPVLLGRDLSAKLAANLDRNSGVPLGPEAGPSTGKNIQASETWHSQPLQDWRDQACPLLAVAVQSIEILENLNTPEDLARIRVLSGESPGA